MFFSPKTLIKKSSRVWKKTVILHNVNQCDNDSYVYDYVCTMYRFSYIYLYEPADVIQLSGTF